MKHSERTHTQKHWREFQIRKTLFLVAYLPLFLPWIGLLLGTFISIPVLETYCTLLFVFFILPLLDALLGKDSLNPSQAETQQLKNKNYYHYLNLFCLPLQLLSLSLGFWYFSNLHSTLQQLGWIISFGIISSTIAINVSHELIHRHDNFSKNTGKLLLATVCYVGFSIEHIKGHHVKVSTPEDASSAKFNQNIFHFLPLAIFYNIKNAFIIENARLKKHHHPFFTIENELLQGYFISAMLLIICFWLGGLLGIIFFLGQSLVAIIELETVNYIEHYGLTRKKKDNGRYEKVTPLHSWNSNDRFSNLLLYNLQRHSDHHAHPHRPFQILRHMKKSPQLPAGYMTMMSVAWLPPLWFAIMNPKVKTFYQVS